jgi:hypothetical protein
MLYRLAVIALLAGTLVLPTPISISDTVQAATTKKKKKSSSDYSSEERKKIMELARQICRKKYGASSTVYRIDYTRKSVICVPPGY